MRRQLRQVSEQPALIIIITIDTVIGSICRLQTFTLFAVLNARHGRSDSAFGSISVRPPAYRFCDHRFHRWNIDSSVRICDVLLRLHLFYCVFQCQCICSPHSSNLCTSLSYKSCILETLFTFYLNLDTIPATWRLLCWYQWFNGRLFIINWHCGCYCHCATLRSCFHVQVSFDHKNLDTVSRCSMAILDLGRYVYSRLIVRAIRYQLIYAVKPGNEAGLYVVMTIIGVCSLSLLPVGLELACEVTRNAEGSSAILWFMLVPCVCFSEYLFWMRFSYRGNLFGVMFILGKPSSQGQSILIIPDFIVQGALRADENATPPLNMHRALVFNGSFIIIACSLIFFVQGNQVRKRSDEENLREMLHQWSTFVLWCSRILSNDRLIWTTAWCGHSHHPFGLSYEIRDKYHQGEFPLSAILILWDLFNLFFFKSAIYCTGLGGRPW